MNDTPRELVSLADSEQTVADGDDIRGFEVKDAAGEDLGKVDELLIDTTERKVRFLVVASGGFLGLGEHKSYVPVDAITGIRDETVHIDQSRERLRTAPAYDPELINEPSYNEDVFGYYGFAPYWTAGYAYPAYPYYR